MASTHAATLQEPTADIEDLIPPKVVNGIIHVDVLNDFDSFEEKKPRNFIEDQDQMEQLVFDLLEEDWKEKKPGVAKAEHMKKGKYNVGMPSSANIRYTYNRMVQLYNIERDFDFEENFRSKKARTVNGIISVTTVTSPKQEIREYPPSNYYYLWRQEMVPQDFSCAFDCYFCPNEPGQVRSYTPGEPGYDRAIRNDFCPVKQFRNRAISFKVNGSIFDKIEHLILGGTWHSYDYRYREWFIACTYYSANTLYDTNFKALPRQMLSLQEEIEINETAQCRIIGMTIETRPDQITPKTLIELREQGITRIQLGVQHIDDDILTIINRQCPTRTTLRTCQMLLDCGFKFDIHLMPDLPGSSLEKDRRMFYFVLFSGLLNADQWKIYPTQCVKHTEIWNMYYQHGGDYKPYAETLITWQEYCDRRQDQLQKLRLEYDLPADLPFCENAYDMDELVNPLFELIIEVKALVHPWIRLNRITRDIPVNLMANLDLIEKIGGGFSNMRQGLQAVIKSRGLCCECIRCREVRAMEIDPTQVRTIVRKYWASGGQEYFISMELIDEDTGHRIMCGFIRLRLSQMPGKWIKRGMQTVETVFHELKGCALIRELHVYGEVTKVHGQKKNAQHFGFGKKLLKKAEEIAFKNGFRKISVIAGVGVREYYRKRGYQDGKYFLIKKLPSYKKKIIGFILIVIVCLIYFFIQ